MEESAKFLHEFATIDYIVIAVYLLVLISVGFLLKKFCKDSKNYFIGGNKVSWWLAGGSCFMMCFSAWTFTGAAGFAYKYGILAILIFWFNSFAFLFTAFFIAGKCRQTRVVTAMGIIRDRYGRFSEQFCTWVRMPLWLLLGAVWLTGFGKFVAVAFNVPIHYTIIISGVVIMIYSTVGGSWGVVATDFLQSIVLLTLVVVMAVLTIIKIGGVGEFIAKVPPEHLKIGDPDHTWIWILAYFLNIFLNFTSIQGAPRYLCVKDGKTAKKVALWASLLFFIGPVLWFLPPIAANYFFPDIGAAIPGMNNPHEGVYVLMGLTLLPHGLSALLIMVVFGATLSSMDSTMNQNAAIITMNFYKPMLRPKADDRELFVVGHIFNVVFGMVAITLALFMARQTKMDLFAVNVFLASTIGASLIVPFVLIYWIRWTPKWSVIVSVSAGLIYSLIGQHGLVIEDSAGCWFCGMLDKIHAMPLLMRLGGPEFDPHVPWSLPFRVFGVLIFGGIAYFATMLFWKRTKQEDKDMIDAFYTRMNTPVDLETEVVGSEDMRQLIIIGNMIRLVGIGVLLLTLVPGNNLSERFVILITGAIITTVGWLFNRAGKRSQAKLEAVEAEGAES